MKFVESLLLHTELCKIDGMKYDKHYMIRYSEKGDKFFYYIITEHGFDRGITHRSLALFQKVIKYKLLDRFKNAYFSETGYLVLVDVNENELHLTGCTPGDSGAGPSRTHQILTSLGLLLRVS